MAVAQPHVHFCRASLDLARERLDERLLIHWFVGLRVDHHPTNLGVRDTQPDHDPDVVALLGARDKKPPAQGEPSSQTC